MESTRSNVLLLVSAAIVAPVSRIRRSARAFLGHKSIGQERQRKECLSVGLNEYCPPCSGLLDVVVLESRFSNIITPRQR